MRLLCSGDLHLGRRSTRLPAGVRHAAAADVWQRLVAAALQHDVDAVLLSGDLVDQDNRYFEAIGPLERGLETLHDAGIPVCAVAGNHDHDVLPALARSLPAGRLQLLGLGGRWEYLTIPARAGAEQMHVLGWSFPERSVRHSPLDEVIPPRPSHAPILGLLHGDLDAPTSPYAPLARAAFARWPASAWLLGHLHAPRLHEGATPLLYPGAPQPLDPGETGVHGAWLAELRADGVFSARLLPLASVMYQAVEVDLTACVSLSDAREAALRALRETLHKSCEENPHLQHLAARVMFTGRTTLHAALQPLVSELLSLDTRSDPDDTPGGTLGGEGAISVTHVHDGSSAPRDLAALSSGSDAIGALASLLVQLERGADAEIDPTLWRAVCAVPSVVTTARPFAGVADADSVTEHTLRRKLARQADLMLAELLQQRANTP